MKVWEKIATFDDTKGWTKERIASEAYALKYCPSEMESTHKFVGWEKFHKHCQFNCDFECLDKYLDMEVKLR
jgi:hypothetical protein